MAYQAHTAQATTRQSDGGFGVHTMLINVEWSNQRDEMAVMLVALAYTRASRDRYEGFAVAGERLQGCAGDGDASDMTSTSGFQRRSRHSDRSGD